MPPQPPDGADDPRLGELLLDNPWPTEIRLTADRRRLVLAFEDQGSHELPAEYLRVESPSAEVRGHSPAERRTPGGKRDVAITGVEPVGNYAVRLVFDDGHSTGIYGWSFLASLIREREARWSDYLERLAAGGLRREP